MNRTNTNESLLRTLRALVPERRLTYGESLRIAELQANRLLEAFDITGPCVPSELITELPRIEVRYEHDLPVSGSTHWEAGLWIITLNADEAFTRRRFSLMHELKNVLDHTTKDRLYGNTLRDRRASDQAERAADHFAACLLMPKRWLKREWFDNGQRLAPLAHELQVSPRALSVRLWHLGLGVEVARCPRTSQRYFRRSDLNTYFRYTPLIEAVA
jgi:hypothetical protein